MVNGVGVTGRSLEIRDALRAAPAPTGPGLHVRRERRPRVSPGARPAPARRPGRSSPSRTLVDAVVRSPLDQDQKGGISSSGGIAPLGFGFRLGLGCRCGGRVVVPAGRGLPGLAVVVAVGVRSVRVPAVRGRVRAWGRAGPR